MFTVLMWPGIPPLPPFSSHHPVLFHSISLSLTHHTHTHTHTRTLTDKQKRERRGCGFDWDQVDYGRVALPGFPPLFGERV